jgi:hypothetical protein
MKEVFVVVESVMDGKQDAFVELTEAFVVVASRMMAHAHAEQQ